MSNEDQFRPISVFIWDINRAERSRQVRWLAPLVEISDGRSCFLKQLKCHCSLDEARSAKPFHLCFPLRDIFTQDYSVCKGNSNLEDQFIAFYNGLFALPKDFGKQTLWKSAPGGDIRQSAAGGRAGWYEDFLQQRISDQSLYKKARDMRRMLGTEADLLLLTTNYVVLVECKFKSAPSTEQYDRHEMMGSTLAKRLKKKYHFSMVVEHERDPRFTQLDIPYVLWSEVKAQLEWKRKQSSSLPSRFLRE